MAVLSNNNIACAIYESLKGKSESEQAQLMPKVVDFLAKKRLISKSSDILARLNKIINIEEGKVEAKIFIAQTLSEANKKELIQSLERRHEGKKIILKEYKDEKLLGGMRIEIDDEVIDLSIKNKIKKLQEHLTREI